MAAWIEKFALPDPWIDFREESSAHDAQVARLSPEPRIEVPHDGHPLSTTGWTILASAAPARDDVRLQLADGSVAIAHLAWKRGRERLPWPSTTIVVSPSIFKTNCSTAGSTSSRCVRALGRSVRPVGAHTDATRVSRARAARAAEPR